MNAELKNRVNAQLFLGYELTGALRGHLKKSKLWQQAQIEGTPLKQITRNEREYLGVFLNRLTPTLKHLHEQEAFLKLSVQQHCPDLNLDKYPVSIFTRVFVS